MIIAVDFDGTCVTYEFPKVGKDIGAVPVLKELVEKGHKIILYTMRSHPDKNNQGKTLSGEIISNDTLQDAIDWSKFTAPWYKKEKFNPKTLKSFDKVFAKCNNSESWKVQLFSHIIEDDKICPYVCISYNYKYCIPYNNDTKHLVGTNEEAPDYYRYWED